MQDTKKFHNILHHKPHLRLLWSHNDRVCAHKKANTGKYKLLLHTAHHLSYPFLLEYIPAWPLRAELKAITCQDKV